MTGFYSSLLPLRQLRHSEAGGKAVIVAIETVAAGTVHAAENTVTKKNNKNRLLTYTYIDQQRASH